VGRNLEIPNSILANVKEYTSDWFSKNEIGHRRNDFEQTSH